MIHEAGHAIAKLMDEYVEPMIPDAKFLQGKSWPNPLFMFANTTTNAKTPKVAGVESPIRPHARRRTWRARTMGAQLERMRARFTRSTDFIGRRPTA